MWSGTALAFEISIEWSLGAEAKSPIQFLYVCSTYAVYLRLAHG
jgi:hypothetical protein